MSRPPPRVTVGIPFRNEERRLGAAIRSILAQTWTDFELLLVDDGSSDASLDVARGFDDLRIRVISDGVRRFLPARLNQIVREARGELVARMDADDVSHPDRLRREIEALEAAGDGCAAVGSWVGLVGDAADRGSRMAVVEASADASPGVALERGLLPHPTLIARRRWLEDNRYDESLTRSEDRDLWCRTAGRTRFAIVTEPLYVLRVVPSDENFLADYLESQRQYRRLLRRYGPASLGRSGVLRAWAVSHGKGLAMRVASAAGAAERVVGRRGRPPTDAERRLIEEALAAGGDAAVQRP